MFEKIKKPRRQDQPRKLAGRTTQGSPGSYAQAAQTDAEISVFHMKLAGI
jgi:hypothetical protein